MLVKKTLKYRLSLNAILTVYITEVALLWLAVCSHILLSWYARHLVSGGTRYDFVTGQGHTFVL